MIVNNTIPPNADSNVTPEVNPAIVDPSDTKKASNIREAVLSAMGGDNIDESVCAIVFSGNRVSIGGDDGSTEMEIEPLCHSCNMYLAYCEKEIEDNREAFLKVMGLLQQIKEHKLFRKTHSNFIAYCDDILEINTSDDEKCHEDEWLTDQAVLESYGLTEAEVLQVEEMAHQELREIIASKESPDEDI